MGKNLARIENPTRHQLLAAMAPETRALYFKAFGILARSGLRVATGRHYAHGDTTFAEMDLPLMTDSPGSVFVSARITHFERQSIAGGDFLGVILSAVVVKEVEDGEAVYTIGHPIACYAGSIGKVCAAWEQLVSVMTDAAKVCETFREVDPSRALID